MWNVGMFLLILIFLENYSTSNNYLKPKGDLFDITQAIYLCAELVERIKQPIHTGEVIMMYIVT